MKFQGKLIIQRPENIQKPTNTRRRMPSSEGMVSRKTSNEEIVDPIEHALTDLKICVSEFCDVCLQELHGL